MLSRLRLAPDLGFIAGGAFGLIIAPDVHDEAAEQALSPFFTTAAQIIATLLIAVALFELPSLYRGYRVRRYLPFRIFVYFLVGEAAAVAGSTTVLSSRGYEFAFALTLAGGLAVLIAVTLAGAENLASQRLHSIAERAKELTGEEERGG